MRKTKSAVKAVRAWAAVDENNVIQMVDWHKSSIEADVDARAFKCRAIPVLITPTPRPRRGKGKEVMCK